MNRIEQYRQSQKNELTLPSGNTVLVRRVSLQNLVSIGSIPNTLINSALQMETKASTNTLSGDDLNTFGQLVNLVAKAGFIDPQLADKPSNQALGVNEMSFEDKQFFFEWCNQEAAKLVTFREAAQQSSDATPTSDDVSPKTVDVSKH